MTPADFEARKLAIQQMDISYGAMVAAINKLIAQRDAEQFADDEKAFTATAKAVIAERIKVMPDVARKLWDEPNQEMAIKGAIGFDGEWQDLIVERALPGVQAFVNSTLANAGTPDKATVGRLNHVKDVALREIGMQFGNQHPQIMVPVVDRRLGAGACDRWQRAVNSPSWWDAKGIPLIQAAIIAYVGASFFQDGGTSSTASGSGSSAGTAAEAAGSGSSGISVAGVETGWSTGVGAIDTAIGDALTGTVAGSLGGGGNHPPQPAPQPQPVQVRQTAQKQQSSPAVPVALLVLAVIAKVALF